MNGRKPTRGDTKHAGNKKPVPAKANDAGKASGTGTKKQQQRTSIATNPGNAKSAPRAVKTTKVYVDSQRRGLAETSPVAIVKREFWFHVFAEVSAYRYPLFLHQLDSKPQEFEAIQHLYNLCKTILTKDEQKEAVRTRLQKKAQRGELVLYTDDE